MPCAPATVSVPPDRPRRLALASASPIRPPATGRRAVRDIWTEVGSDRADPRRNQAWPRSRSRPAAPTATPGIGTIP